MRKRYELDSVVLVNTEPPEEADAVIALLADGWEPFATTPLVEEHSADRFRTHTREYYLLFRREVENA